MIRKRREKGPDRRPPGIRIAPSGPGPIQTLGRKAYSRPPGADARGGEERTVMTSPAFVFLILFLTLGPLRAASVFAGRSAGLCKADQRALALKTVGFIAAIIALVAVSGLVLHSAWGGARGPLSLAVGLVLLTSALGLMRRPGRNGATARPSDAPPSAASLAAGVVTSYGAAMILLFMTLDNGDGRFGAQVAGVLATIVAADLVAMLNAQALSRAGAEHLAQAAAWTLTPLLAAVAIQAIVTPLAAAGERLDQRIESRAADSDLDADAENAAIRTPAPLALPFADRGGRREST